MIVLKPAVIVEVPLAAALIRPGVVVLTLATLVFDESQYTLDVRLLVLPSLYVPVAVNCCDVPIATLGLAGVTAIDVRYGWPVPKRFTL